MERLTISRKYLALWRDLARAAVVARQFSRRAALHHRDSMVRHAFHAWQLHWREQQCLHHTYRAVVSRSNTSLIGGVYCRWRHTFRFQRAYRALKASRRERLLCAVLYYWQSHTRLRRYLNKLRDRSQVQTARGVWQRRRQYICQRQQWVNQNAIAQSHFLRCQWETLVRQVQHRIERRHLVERHLKKRWKRTLEVCFDGWLEFLERKNRYRLGIKWYHQRLLETALDGWKAAHDRAHYMKTLEKRAHKKMCRYRLRRCLQQWRLIARYLRHRAAQLKVSQSDAACTV